MPSSVRKYIQQGKNILKKKLRGGKPVLPYYNPEQRVDFALLQSRGAKSTYATSDYRMTSV